MRLVRLVVRRREKEREKNAFKSHNNVIFGEEKHVDEWKKKKINLKNRNEIHLTADEMSGHKYQNSFLYLIRNSNIRQGKEKCVPYR